jgi:hypothetical protein
MKNRTIRKILTALLVALLCLLPLFACGGGDGGDGGGGVEQNTPTNPPDGGQPDPPDPPDPPGMAMDGKDTEQEWLNAPVLTTFGRNGYAVSVKCFRDESSVFFYFSVMDSCLLTESGGNIGNITRGDSVELYIDTRCDGGEKPQTDDFQFNFGVDGRSRILRGTGNAWQQWNGLVDYGVSISYGTLNDGIAPTDVGYGVEVSIPYARIGLQKDAPFGIAFGHVDKRGLGGISGADWDWYGWTWDGENIDPQVPDAYIVLSGDNVLRFRDDMPGSLCTLAGTVKDASSGSPAEGAAVTVRGSGSPVLTDAYGGYMLHGVSPDSTLTVDIAKDGYFNKSIVYARAEMLAAEGGSVVKETNIYSEAATPRTAVTGKLHNAVDGYIGGASVTFEPSGLTAASAPDGSFSIGNAPLTDDARIIVSKAGYESAAYAVTGAGASVDLGDLDMSLSYGNAVVAGGAFGINEFTIRVTRTATGARFLCETDTVFSGGNYLFLYLRYGVNLPIAVWMSADGGKGDDKPGRPEFAHPNLNAVSFAVEPRERRRDGATVTVDIPYTFLNNMPADAPFTFSAGASKQDVGWVGLTAGGTFIDPEIPSLYLTASPRNAVG